MFHFRCIFYCIAFVLFLFAVFIYLFSGTVQDGEINKAVYILRHGDSVDNTVEENSGVFSLIRMRWLPSARACWQ